MTTTEFSPERVRMACVMAGQPSRHSSGEPDGMEGNLSYNGRLLFKEGDNAEKGRVIAKLRGADANPSPRGPGILADIILNVGKDRIRAFHDAAAVYQQLWIEGVNGRDRRSSPDAEAMVDELARDF